MMSTIQPDNLNPETPDLEAIRRIRPIEKFHEAEIDGFPVERWPMGLFPIFGGFSPPLEEGQFEVVCICLETVLSDCITVRAKVEDDGIVFDVVDDYGNEGVGEVIKRFDQVPTQGELFDWLASIENDEGWDFVFPYWLYDGELEKSLPMVRVNSDVYPDLHTLYEAHVRENFDAKKRKHGFDRP